MFSQKLKDELKKRGFDPEKLISAAKEEKEVDVEFGEGDFFSPEELNKRDESIGKKKYEEGKKVGQEKLIGDIRKEEGLEFTGETKENLLSALKNKYEGEKSKDIDQKVKDRDKRINELTTSLQQKEEAYSKLEGDYNTFKSDYELISLLPENRNSALTNEEWVGRLRRTGVVIEEENGKKQVRIGGQLIEDDKTKQPLAPKDAIASLFTKNEGWLLQQQQQQQQRKRPGFGDNPPANNNGIFKTKKEFDTAMTEEGISYTNQAYQQRLNEALKANPEMDMAS